MSYQHLSLIPARPKPVKFYKWLGKALAQLEAMIATCEMTETCRVDDLYVDAQVEQLAAAMRTAADRISSGVEYRRDQRRKVRQFELRKRPT